jgi:hypothetical protein
MVNFYLGKEQVEQRKLAPGRCSDLVVGALFVQQRRKEYLREVDARQLNSAASRLQHLRKYVIS